MCLVAGSVNCKSRGKCVTADSQTWDARHVTSSRALCGLAVGPAGGSVGMATGVVPLMVGETGLHSREGLVIPCLKEATAALAPGICGALLPLSTLHPLVAAHGRAQAASGASGLGWKGTQRVQAVVGLRTVRSGQGQGQWAQSEWAGCQQGCAPGQHDLPHEPAGRACICANGGLTALPSYYVYESADGCRPAWWVRGLLQVSLPGCPRSTNLLAAPVRSRHLLRWQVSNATINQRVVFPARSMLQNRRRVPLGGTVMAEGQVTGRRWSHRHFEEGLCAHVH